MKKAVLVTSHLSFWLFTFLSIPKLFFFFYTDICFHFKYPNGSTPVSYTIDDDFRATLVILLIGVCIFYASYFSLKSFVKRPFFFLGNLSLYLVYSLVVSLPADLISYSAAIKLGPLLYFNVFGFLFKACEEWLNDRTLRLELEKDRTATQLELLKAKIDPHFLFNNLNNIDVFIEEDPKAASLYMKKLSEILRFMLYDTCHEKVALVKEIDYISQYIDLQRIRTANADFVNLKINGDIAGKFLPPMILIHFIENAFKFATNKKIKDAVDIRLDVTRKHLSFYCKNHMHPTAETGVSKNGIGLGLLTQKLDLLYKKEYKLVTKAENNWYIVSLDIPLDEN